MKPTDYRFPKSDLKVRMLTFKDGSGGFAAAYTEARPVMDALDKLFDGQWSTYVEPLDRLTQSGEFQVVLKLQVLDQTYSDVGIGRDYKDAVSDGIKRAACQVGIGRFLWQATQVWVPAAKLDVRGKQAFIKREHEKAVLGQLIGRFYK